MLAVIRKFEQHLTERRSSVSRVSAPCSACYDSSGEGRQGAKILPPETKQFRRLRTPRRAGVTLIFLERVSLE
jgi:hypothetical protein